MFCNQCGMETGKEPPFWLKCGGRCIETVSTPTYADAAVAPARYPVPPSRPKKPQSDVAVWILFPILLFGIWCTAVATRQFQRLSATSQIEQIAAVSPLVLFGKYYWRNRAASVGSEIEDLSISRPECRNDHRARSADL